MKKLPLLVFCLLIGFGAMAQTYTISNKVNYLNCSAGDNYIESIVTITNTGNADTQFTWVRLDQNLLSGWGVQLCDPITCFDPVPASNSFTLKKGKSGLLSFKITPNGKVGTGKINIGLSLNGASGPFDTITFNVNSWANGVSSSAKLPDLSVYPNPAQNEITINYDSKFNYQIDIVNIIGNRVRSYNNVDGPVKLDISDLPDGVYIVKIFDRGKVLTRRITKS